MPSTRVAVHSPAQPGSVRTSTHDTRGSNLPHPSRADLNPAGVITESLDASRRDSAIAVNTGENDIESSLHGLEEDRRTWISRREKGSLEVTPPKEGRFEKFLS